MDKRFRYGVIGTGMMGVEHIMNITHIEDAEVTAIADPNQASLSSAASIVPAAVALTSSSELLSSGLCDAVVIASPNHTHIDVLSEALATDLHILVEKPLCTTVADCRTVVDAAADRSAVTWVGLEYRYMPPVARLIEEVHAGTVGDLRMLAIREHRFPFLVKVDNWNRFSANTGGTLVEKCCHFFDLMNHITGDRPVRVMASGGQDVNHLDEDYDGRTPDILDNAYVIVEYERGARALLDLCMFADATAEQEEISAVGPKAKVEAFLPSQTVRIGIRGRDWIGGVDSFTVHDPRVTYEGHHHGSSQLEHLDFIATCRSGEKPKVALEDGLLSVAMGVAAHRSIEEGRPVEMAEVL